MLKAFVYSSLALTMIGCAPSDDSSPDAAETNKVENIQPKENPVKDNLNLGNENPEDGNLIDFTSATNIRQNVVPSQTLIEGQATQVFEYVTEVKLNGISDEGLFIFQIENPNLKYHLKMYNNSDMALDTFNLNIYNQNKKLIYANYIWNEDVYLNEKLDVGTYYMRITSNSDYSTKYNLIISNANLELNNDDNSENINDDNSDDTTSTKDDDLVNSNDNSSEDTISADDEKPEEPKETISDNNIEQPESDLIVPQDAHSKHLRLLANSLYITDDEKDLSIGGGESKRDFVDRDGIEGDVRTILIRRLGQIPIDIVATASKSISKDGNYLGIDYSGHGNEVNTGMIDAFIESERVNIESLEKVISNPNITIEQMRKLARQVIDKGQLKNRRYYSAFFLNQNTDASVFAILDASSDVDEKLNLYNRILHPNYPTENLNYDLLSGYDLLPSIPKEQSKRILIDTINNSSGGGSNLADYSFISSVLSDYNNKIAIDTELLNSSGVKLKLYYEKFSSAEMDNEFEQILYTVIELMVTKELPLEDRFRVMSSLASYLSTIDSQSAVSIFREYISSYLNKVGSFSNFEKYDFSSLLRYTLNFSTIPSDEITNYYNLGIEDIYGSIIAHPNVSSDVYNNIKELVTTDSFIGHGILKNPNTSKDDYIKYQEYADSSTLGNLPTEAFLNVYRNDDSISSDQYPEEFAKRDITDQQFMDLIDAGKGFWLIYDSVKLNHDVLDYMYNYLVSNNGTSIEGFLEAESISTSLLTKIYNEFVVDHQNFSGRKDATITKLLLTHQNVPVEIIDDVFSDVKDNPLSKLDVSDLTRSKALSTEYLNIIAHGMEQRLEKGFSKSSNSEFELGTIAAQTSVRVINSTAFQSNENFLSAYVQRFKDYESSGVKLDVYGEIKSNLARYIDPIEE